MRIHRSTVAFPHRKQIFSSKICVPKHAKTARATLAPFDPAAPWTLGKLQRWTYQRFAKFPTRGGADPRMTAEIYLANYLRISRQDLFLQPAEPLTRGVMNCNLSGFEQGIKDLEAGKPIQHLVGRQIFYGRIFHVGDGVFIPRGETQTLVTVALEALRRMNPYDHTLFAADLCTGSGNVACTLALEVPELRLDAVDISLEAMRYTRENIHRHGLESRVRLLHRDLLKSSTLVAGRRYRLITCNPPYAPSDKFQGKEVKWWEPQLAIDGGDRGMDIVIRTLDLCPDLLQDDGVLVMEFLKTQTTEVRELIAARPYWRNSLVLENTPGPTTVLIASPHTEMKIEEWNLGPFEVKMKDLGSAVVSHGDNYTLSGLVDEFLPARKRLDHLLRQHNLPEGTALSQEIAAVCMCHDRWRENSHVNPKPDLIDVISLHFRVMSFLDEHGTASKHFNLEHLAQVEYANASLVTLGTIMILMDAARRNIAEVKSVRQKNREYLEKFLDFGKLDALIADAQEYIANARLLVTGHASPEGRRLNAAVYRNWNEVRGGLAHLNNDLRHWISYLGFQSVKGGPFDFM